MAKIEIYTTTYCPYCTRAKELLKKKGVAFEEIDVTNDMAMREALVAKSNGRKTVPQIFINAQPVGGFDDINALDKAGKLDALLAT
jgi:glutaredoxin 3